MGTGRRTRSWQGVQGEDYVPENCGVPKLSTMTIVWSFSSLDSYFEQGFRGYMREMLLANKGWLYTLVGRLRQQS